MRGGAQRARHLPEELELGVGKGNRRLCGFCGRIIHWIRSIVETNPRAGGDEPRGQLRGLTRKHPLSPTQRRGWSKRRRNLLDLLEHEWESGSPQSRLGVSFYQACKSRRRTGYEDVPGSRNKDSMHKDRGTWKSLERSFAERVFPGYQRTSTSGLRVARERISAG